MPVGLIVMKWDIRLGTKIEAVYPEEIEVSEDTLMQIYSAHEYSGEPGVISLMVGPLNLVSYYGGPDVRYYVVLLLNLDEDPDAYEGGLSDISRMILQNVEEKTFKTLLPSLFHRISVYPSLSEELRLAITYEDQVKRMIIERLREEGVFTKSELVIWLKDKYRHGYVDINALIVDLIKIDLIKESSVKGMPSELIFFINDLLISRRPPPNKLLKNSVEKGLPENFANDYYIEVKNFFQNYRPSEEDNLKLINIFMNPQVYETLKLLRTSICTKNEIEKLKKKGVEDVDGVLKTLWENQIVHVFQSSEGIEYYALLSDFYITKIFPKYILQTIISEYGVKSKSDKVLIEYLNVLEDAYFEHKAQFKAKSKQST